ncbi:MAG: hypothetical protein MI864_25360, partial [Pseudomonadales bacterium]|nr:hypothetical protein [Pseudomonadales bacterium]
MIDIKDYYETILWPAPYVRQALKRSAQLPESLSALKNLYQYTFAEHRIFSTDTPFELPLSQKLEPQKPAELVAHDDNIPLSIVTITRNDDHVERMQERTQAFIDSLYWLSEHYAKPVELIIVEWNPPSDRKPLGAQFKFRKKHPYLSIIIITVPSEIHQNYQLADDLPLYQMIGKNVGIRRARGKFVLATNIDVLLS